MVRFLPEELTGKKPDSERSVLRAAAALDDSWLCLHGITYDVHRNLRRSYGNSGEIDVLLVHRDVGFVAIEAKGGMYVWDQRGLRTASGKEIDPTPREQNFRTRANILEFAKGQAYLPFYLLSSFPDMDSIRPFGPANSEDSVLWRGHLDPPERLSERIAALVDRRWSDSEDRKSKVISEIAEWLCPSGRVPTVSQQVRYSNERIASATLSVVQLFEGQLAVAHRQGHVMRTITSGPAGTGKSLLAVERARRLARLGNRVLFFTPNSRQHSEVIEVLAAEGLLATGNRLEAVAPGSVHVRTLDLVARGVEEIERTSKALAEVILSWDVTFDALVIDECQDLDEDLYSALQLRLDSSEVQSQVHAFGDANQAAGLRAPWRPSADFTQLFLSIACRCARPIQTLINGVLPTGVDLHDVEGPPVRMIAASPQAAVQAALDEIKYLIHNQGLKSEQIQTLIAGEPDPDWAHHAVNTFRRAALGMKPSVRLPLLPDAFKGCEADAVVLVCAAPNVTESVQRELYVGLSRAKAQLSVVATPELLGSIAPQVSESGGSRPTP